MISTLDVERTYFLTCGVGKDYRRAEVCLGVDWRLGVSVEQFDCQTAHMVVRKATWLRMVLD